MEIDIKLIKENPKNPRTISKDKFELLKKSIQEFPQMLTLRPLVIDKDNIVLGGNMRLKALLALGYKKVPVMRANELTEAQKKKFLILDNNSFGEWDVEKLEMEWADMPLLELGMDTDFSYLKAIDNFGEKENQSEKEIADNIEKIKAAKKKQVKESGETFVVLSFKTVKEKNDWLMSNGYEAETKYPDPHHFKRVDNQ